MMGIERSVQDALVFLFLLLRINFYVIPAVKNQRRLVIDGQTDNIRKIVESEKSQI
jgi:hypothetical protein